MIFIAEAVERVFVPLAFVYLVLQLIPLGVLAGFGLFGCQHLSQIFAEVGGYTLFVVHGLVFEFDGQFFERVAYLGGDVFVFAHLVEYRIAAIEGVFRTTARVVE